MSKHIISTKAKKNYPLFAHNVVSAAVTELITYGLKKETAILNSLNLT